MSEPPEDELAQMRRKIQEQIADEKARNPGGLEGSISRHPSQYGAETDRPEEGAVHMPETSAPADSDLDTWFHKVYAAIVEFIGLLPRSNSDGPITRTFTRVGANIEVTLKKSVVSVVGQEREDWVLRRIQVHCREAGYATVLHKRESDGTRVLVIDPH